MPLSFRLSAYANILCTVLSGCIEMPITHIRLNTTSSVLPFFQIPALYPRNDMVHIHHTQTGG